MSCVTITRTSSDKLVRSEWRWYFNDRKNHLVLDHYTYRVRKTTKHRFGASSLVECYARCDARANTIPAQKVPMSEDLEKEALKKFAEKIEVVKDGPSRTTRHW